jgi:hypothetical protein
MFVIAGCRIIDQRAWSTQMPPTWSQLSTMINALKWNRVRKFVQLFFYPRNVRANHQTSCGQRILRWRSTPWTELRPRSLILGRAPEQARTRIATSRLRCTEWLWLVPCAAQLVRCRRGLKQRLHQLQSRRWGCDRCGSRRHTKKWMSGCQVGSTHRHHITIAIKQGEKVHPDHQKIMRKPFAVAHDDWSLAYDYGQKQNMDRSSTDETPGRWDKCVGYKT